MKTNNRLIGMILALTILVMTAFSSAAAAAEISSDAVMTGDGGGFVYQHDPTDNPTAMKDIVRDENAVYGFRPSATGSLKQYAEMDWSDPNLVAAGREERIAYHTSIAAMYDTLRQMEDEGKSIEETARTLSRMRNTIRMDAYRDDPEGLEVMKQRNLEKYGHEEGPLPDELYEQYGSWEKVLEKAFSTNSGMDACLGLYDDYYYLYVALGQVDDLSVVTDQHLLGDTDGDGSVSVMDATVIQRYLAEFTVENPDVVVLCGDLDGNGLDIMDATRIQRYLAEFETPYAIGETIA